MANHRQNQPRIDTYFNKKNIKSSSRVNNHQHSKLHNDYHKSQLRGHSSSRQRQSQGTQLIQEQEACPQYIMISAKDSIYQAPIFNNIRKLLDNYTKDKAIELFQKNARIYFPQKSNVNNLSRIDDKKFWNITLPKLLQLIFEQSDKISACVQTLYINSNKVVKLTKLQCLLILGQMFLCILPKQMYTRNNSSFSFWLKSSSQQKLMPGQETKLQKLKCLINYFNLMIERKSMFDQQIQFQRTTKQLQQVDHNATPLRAVQVKCGKIQQYYGEEIMIDFANKNIGGGILSRGAVQQQIMFATFPQLIITTVLCETMEDHQAIIIYGAEKFSNYQGYSQSFRFTTPCQLSAYTSSNSVIIAIDAVNYSQFSNTNAQWSKMHMQRQINKAITGFSGAGFRAKEQMRICTGKWGCGAFLGDLHLKFMLQWIACSICDRQMIFMADYEQIKQLRIIVKQLIQYTVSDIFSILQEYSKFRIKQSNIPLIDYIKDFVV